MSNIAIKPNKSKDADSDIEEVQTTSLDVRDWVQHLSKLFDTLNGSPGTNKALLIDDFKIGMTDQQKQYFVEFFETIRVELMSKTCWRIHRFNVTASTITTLPKIKGHTFYYRFNKEATVSIPPPGLTVPLNSTTSKTIPEIKSTSNSSSPTNNNKRKQPSVDDLSTRILDRIIELNEIGNPHTIDWWLIILDIKEITNNILTNWFDTWRHDEDKFAIIRKPLKNSSHIRMYAIIQQEPILSTAVSVTCSSCKLVTISILPHMKEGSIEEKQFLEFQRCLKRIPEIESMVKFN